LIQLATQFYATLCYLSTYHDHSPAVSPANAPTTIPQLAKIPKNPPQATPASSSDTDPQPAAPRPDSPTTFALRQRELARDLIIKEQQIEYLIGVLPGIGSSETEQENRIRQLEDELRRAEVERLRKRRELRRLGERVDNVLGAVARGSGVGIAERPWS
jgi:mediator of RNA polymerase II transcription subunit 21